MSASAQSGATPFCGAKPTITDTTDRAIDAQHPKYFVEISEVSSRGHKRLIHTSIPSRVGQERIVCQRVNAPVDIDGKIQVHINQSFLRLYHFGGKFAITARVDGANGSRPVEVPGYSVIGKESNTSPVTVADFSGLMAAMREIRKEQKNVEVGLTAAHVKTASRDTALQDSVRVHAAHVDTLQMRLQADSASMQNVAVAAASLLDSLRRGTPDSTGSFKAAQVRVDNVQREATMHLAELQKAKAILRNDSLLLVAGTLPEYLREVRSVLAARQHTRLALKVVTDPQNAALIRTYARGREKLPQLIVGVARTTDSLWHAILAEPFDSVSLPDAKKWSTAVASFEASFAELSDDQGSDSEDEVTNVLVIDAMRDAEITVRQTGAEVGDVLVLTMSDTVGDPGASRTLEVRLPIREFGFVRRITDAVLFMNVPALREGAELTDAQSEADRSGVGSSRTFPLNLRGAPSAGVTLAWTYLPRLDDDYASLRYGLRSIFNWLRPGVGFNASVISVAHKTITITPLAAPTEEAKDPDLGYTVGIITSAFDNAMQWSVGRTLNGDKARTYTALGLSFLAATDKAKDLFKALVK
jgi:hypothetical protein